MSEARKKYLERMGYMPCYLFPEKLGEDEEFEYYKFRVPRHYIREHMADGDIWPNYEETEEEGIKDNSVVLGVGFFPVYTGVEYLNSDADFLYYKVRVPKVFLDSPIAGSKLTYKTLYEAKTINLETAEQKAERESADIECEKVPKAGESMPDKEVLSAVRKVKESKPILYEIIFKCKNEEECGLEFKEIGSDLFEMLYARCCSVCDCPRLDLKGCKVLAEEDEDG